MANADRPGPTGDFPEGKLNEDDEGGIQVALSHADTPDGRRVVRIDFGKPIAWLGLPRLRALEFARLIIEHAGGKG